MASNNKPFRCTKRAVESVKIATTLCYEQAEQEMKQKWTKENKVFDIDNGFFSSFEPEFKAELDALYRHKVCSLNSAILEAILICHNKGKYRRARITLEAIKNELASRHLLQDYSAPN